MPLDFNPLANAERLVHATIAEVMEPPPPVDFSKWAADNIVFGTESSRPGPYDPERLPALKRVFDVLSPEHPARVVSVMGPVQIGKSVIAQIFMAASMDIDPCQAIYYHPTDSNATEWVRTKWKPMVRNSARLKEVFGTEKSRDGGQSMMFYERRDGRGALLVSGSNSPQAVQMKSARIQVHDDVALWEMLSSGDSEKQADGRSDDFPFAKILKISKPLVEPGCRITRSYKAGTQEHLHVPCPHCGLFQALEWENMVACLDPEDPDDAHFTCTGCSGRIDEGDMPALKPLAVFVPHNPVAREPSFYLAPFFFRAWAELARGWLVAKGKPADEQTFLNDKIGLPYKGATESPPWEELKARYDATGHRLGLVPHGGLIVTAGIDCQKSFVAAHIKAFGPEGRRWTIEYRPIEGHISESATRAKLDALLKETWPDEYGNQRPLQMLAIDGNAWTDDVMDWARTHPWSRVIVTRGHKSETAAPLLPVKSERRNDGKARRQQKRFYNLGVSRLKTTLYTALGKRDPLERSYCGYPKGLDDSFYQELAAERRVPKKSRDGQVEYRWVKDAEQANEVLDTELIAEGAAIRCGWRALTEKTAAEMEARLVAEGELARQSKAPDLFDPARAVAANAVRQPASGEQPQSEAATLAARLA